VVARQAQNQATQGRDFTLIGGAAAAWPLAARAQQSDRIRRIGALMSLAADDPESQAWLAAFLQGMQELGWTVGHNLRIDYRGGAGDVDRMSPPMDAKALLLSPLQFAFTAAVSFQSPSGFHNRSGSFGARISIFYPARYPQKGGGGQEGGVCSGCRHASARFCLQLSSKKLPSSSYRFAAAPDAPVTTPAADFVSPARAAESDTLITSCFSK
jgi:hypothetical protein